MRSLLYSLLVYLTLTSVSSAQGKDSIVNAFKDYVKTPREIAYLNLNKSIYIKGENIGFMAYVFDKKTKRNSQIATNLYVSIEDDSKKVIKQKLLKLENGIASNIFELDSTFTSGYYTVKAYTNWMLNFKQQDYFSESIRVIDPKIEEYIESDMDSDRVKTSIDAQFLPESGHLVDRIRNTVGVVLKDHNGFGLPNVKGTVYNNNVLISEFQVNHLGIGKFLLFPERGNDYTIKINYLDKEYSFYLNETIESTGVIVNVLESKNKAFITLSTNEPSLSSLKNKPYTLTLHNGDGIYGQDIIFNTSTSITKSFDLSSLPMGLNIFTLFNENNQPIAERLFFNYNSLQILKSQSIAVENDKDFISLNIKLNHIDPSKFNSLSVSVLPKNTESHSRHSNILSQSLLKPYIKGQIENAKYYFTEIDAKTKLDMDNLLLTQGWSSYNWKDIFDNKTEYEFQFEQGITLKANVNDVKNTEAYMVDINNDNMPLIIKPKLNEETFSIENVFIEEDKNVYITEVKKNSDLKTPKLYLQSYPNRIPSLNRNIKVLKPIQNSLTYLNADSSKIQSLNKEQKLDEVLVTTEIDKNLTRTEELNKGSFGNVSVITEEDRLTFFSLEDYIRTKGIIVSETRATRGSDPNSGIRFYTGRSISINKTLLMDIFVDDNYFGTSIGPRSFFLANIDYIEIIKSGLGQGTGQGFKGTGGVIRIYTNQKNLNTSPTRKKSKKYNLPLKFAANKKFYIPPYNYSNKDFYLKYGTIDWKPQITSDANGNFSISIINPKVPIILFIEGIANDGSFIFEEKTISLN